MPYIDRGSDLSRDYWNATPKMEYKPVTIMTIMIVILVTIIAIIILQDTGILEMIK